MRLRKGFTLIELLVVIAIIAILAAILFPVFLTAKARAQQASCVQNMKQIALALQTYLGNWDDTYPMNRYRDPIMPRTGAMNYSRYNWKRSLSTCMKTKGAVWTCPGNPMVYDRDSQNRIDETGQCDKATWYTNAYPRSYALNGDIFNDLDGNYNLIPLKASSIPQPSKVIFILESRFSAPDLNSGMIDTKLNSGWEYKAGSKKGWINVHIGHTTNFIFTDTHTQAISVAQSMTPRTFWEKDGKNQGVYDERATNLPDDCYK